MSQDIKEYAITYAVKDYLLSLNWDVIAYNPPGSQGTFTIPNPSKDGSYRGQTGSESPDVIAIKKNVVLVVECKPSFDLDDAQKLKRLSDDPMKMEILGILIERVCAANEITLTGDLEFIYALAYQGGPHTEKNLGLIKVEVSDEIDITNLNAESSYESYFSASLLPASIWVEKILGLFEN
jgi:hypothetical protein